MKLIIDIPEMAYEAFKEWHKNKVSTVEQSIIANGIPYEERPQGDLISREALKHKFAQITYVRFTADMGQGGFEMFSEKEIEDIIDKATTVSDRYGEGYAQGYIDGSTGADMRGEE